MLSQLLNQYAHSDVTACIPALDGLQTHAVVDKTVYAIY